MSEVLLDFVEPYMESVPTEEKLGKLLTLGIAAWNAALMPPAQREEFIEETAQSFPPALRSEYRTILEPLIQRKLKHFAANRRAMLNFSLTMEAAGPYVQVVSSLPQR